MLHKNIHCDPSLEPSRRDGSNKGSHCMFCQDGSNEGSRMFLRIIVSYPFHSGNLRQVLYSAQSFLANLYKCIGRAILHYSPLALAKFLRFLHYSFLSEGQGTDR